MTMLQASGPLKLLKKSGKSLSFVVASLCLKIVAIMYNSLNAQLSDYFMSAILYKYVLGNYYYMLLKIYYLFEIIAKFKARCNNNLLFI